MTEFDAIWTFINRHGTPVQERTELEHVFNLVRNSACRSYLEIGSAEGNSLYAIANAIPQMFVHGTEIAKRGRITTVDFGETHTQKQYLEVLKEISPFVTVNTIHGDSTHSSTYRKAMGKYDCVLIDGGHDFATVLSDAILYGQMAMKYLFFHDIQLPEVRSAFEWYMKRGNPGKETRFINSETYGYAIVEMGVK